MIELTETAAAVVLAAIKGNPKQIAGLRLIAEEGGCSGPRYEMGLVEVARAEDLWCESRGVTIYIENASLDLIKGTSIDYVTEAAGTGFKFKNPAARSKGGCGKICC
jgi:iron-sulfur cluster assembly accessory protein